VAGACKTNGFDGPANEPGSVAFCFVKRSTNLDVTTEEPTTYLDRLDVPKAKLRKELRNQCIPGDLELRRVANYNAFLVERRKLLAAAANTFLDL
jgi:hypothetical protein